MTVPSTGIVHTRHGARTRVARTKGAFSGLVLVALGVWGALIPFVGPSLDYGYSPSGSWHWTLWRFWLEVLPGSAAVLGGLLLLTSSNRVTASVGSWLSAAGGAWFVVGLPLASMVGIHDVGTPLGSSADTRAWETVGMFSGLGVAIVLFAAFALGRLAVVGVRDVAAADRFAARQESDRLAAERADAEAAATRERAGRTTVQPTSEPTARGQVDDSAEYAPETRLAEPTTDTTAPASDRRIGGRLRR